MFAKDSIRIRQRFNRKGSTNAFRVHGVISVVGVRPRSEATERNGDVSSDNITAFSVAMNTTVMKSHRSYHQQQQRLNKEKQR